MNRKDSQRPTSAEAPASLTAVLDQLLCICQAHRDGAVSVADVQDVVGQRSFGPLLLVPGFVALSPIGAIPGLPGVMAVIELFFASQILFGRKHPWLPKTIANCAMKAATLGSVVSWIRPYAAWVDGHLLRPRLDVFTRGPFFILIALMCIAISLIMPVIELVPLAGIVPNAALTAFGLAVTAHDGLWALIAMMTTAASVYLLFMMF